MSPNEYHDAALEKVAEILRGAQDDLKASNQKAEKAAWTRLKSELEEAIYKWGVDEVRGLIDDILEERKEAAAEEARIRDEDEQYFLRKFGHYRLEEEE